MNVLPLLAELSDPIAHVVDAPLVQVGHDMPFYLSSDGTLWLISNVTVMLVVSAIITALLIIPAAKRIAVGNTGTLEDLQSRGVLANLVESVCLYMRDEVFRPVLEDQTDKYTPMLWTFFWYILICNLLGLLPLKDLTTLFDWGHAGHGIGGTATQPIWVTGGLALVAFLFWNIIAFTKDPIGFLKHLTAGAPVYMWPIMVPVELLGMIVKPVALALRLFANMTGGHIIIAVLLSFVAGLIQGLGTWGYPLAVIPVLGATAIYMLEVMVAFIQAYIFTFLTCLFLGQLVVHEHEEHEEHGEHHEDHSIIGHSDKEKQQNWASQGEVVVERAQARVSPA